MKLLHLFLAALCGLASLQATTESSPRTKFTNTYQEFAKVMQESPKLQNGFVLFMAVSVAIAYVGTGYPDKQDVYIVGNMPDQVSSLLNDQNYAKAAQLMKKYPKEVKLWIPREQVGIKSLIYQLLADLHTQHTMIDRSMIYYYVKKPAHRLVNQSIAHLESMLAILDDNS